MSDLTLVPAAQLGLVDDPPHVPDELPGERGYDVVNGCAACEQRDTTIAVLRAEVARLRAELAQVRADLRVAVLDADERGGE